MVDKSKRGRKRLGESVLRPDGTTPEIYEVMRIIAEERGISIADVRRELLAEKLKEMGYSDEDLGLVSNA